MALQVSQLPDSVGDVSAALFRQPSTNASPSTPSDAANVMGPLTAPTMMQPVPGGLRLGSPISGPTRTTLPPVTPPSSTNPITPAPHPTLPASSPGPVSYTGPIFGGGWSQYATTPGTIPYALGQQFSQGVYGQQAVDALNQNPATSGVAYYADKGEYGLPGGYYIAPNASGSLDLIQRAAGDNGQASSSPDLTGLLTQFLSAFKAPTNNLAATPAPVAPNLAPTAPSTSSVPTNPITGLPLFSQNPVTGAITTNAAGVSTPFGLMPTPADVGSVTTQSINPGEPGPVYGGPVTGTPTPPPTTPGRTPPPGASYVGPAVSPGASSAPPDLSTVIPNLIGAEQLGKGPGGSYVAPGGSAATSSNNPFTDPTQMQLWNQVMAVLNQANQPVGNNPQTQALQAAIAQLATQLQGPAFTDQQLNDIRTASMDSIQSDEDNAIQAEIQRQGLLGQAPTSGTVTDAVNKIKASYTTLKGQAQQASNMYELNTVQQRQQELLQTLNLGATTATNNQQLGFQNAVTGAQLSTLPVSAENTALQNALSVTAAGQSSAATMLQALLQEIALNNQSGQINGQNNAALAAQLGQLLSGFL